MKILKEWIDTSYAGIGSKLRESYILKEGTDYPKQATQMLTQSGLYSSSVSEKIVNALYRGIDGGEPDIHAFVHAPNWLSKYLKGIVRMLIEYAGGSQSRAQEFLAESPAFFEQFLTWVKANRADENAKKLDNSFVNEWSYEDCQEYFREVQSEINKQSDDELSRMKERKSGYKAILINDFKQLNNLFGGLKTGDGESTRSAWCHTNGEGTYNSWVNRGENVFIILAESGWESIKPIPKDGCPKDEYGLSLMALRVKVETGELMNCTLRWNHVHTPSNADNQFTTYAEISKVVGFNVKEAVRDLLEKCRSELEDLKANASKVLSQELKRLTEIDKRTEIRGISLPEFVNEYEIAEIRIPNNITKIGSSTFLGCELLRFIEIPNSVTKIGSSAFYGCRLLKSIKIPDGVEIIDSGTFFECTSLESVKIPSSVAKIGSNAFFECESLKSIEIPDGVLAIDSGAFRGCLSLESIKIPDGVTEIDSNVFKGCASLKSIKIPDGVTRIGVNAFSSCESLQSVEIPDGVTRIGANAFSSCESLQSVEIPDGVTRIGVNAFFSCESLQSVEIPDGVIQIGANAFSSCESLQSVEIPDGVIQIGANAFSSCESIKSIKLPASITAIAGYTFRNCTSLESIKIPDGVTLIGCEAFSGCTSLKSVRIPKSVTLIGYGAFDNHTNITPTDHKAVRDYYRLK